MVSSACFSDTVLSRPDCWPEIPEYRKFRNLQAAVLPVPVRISAHLCTKTGVRPCGLRILWKIPFLLPQIHTVPAKSAQTGAQTILSAKSWIHRFRISVQHEDLLQNKIVGTIRSHGCPYLKSVFCLTKLPDVTGSDQGNSASFHFRGQRIRNGRSLSGVWVYISVLFFWPDADLPENARVSSTVNCFKISCTNPWSP